MLKHRRLGSGPKHEERERKSDSLIVWQQEVTENPIAVKESEKNRITEP